MKNSKHISLLLWIATTLVISSCQPMEPNVYTQQFYRVATVESHDGKASIVPDHTGEVFTFKNFSTTSDMSNFGVTHGDRVIADITMKVTEDILEKSTLNALHKLTTYPLADSEPSDTLNHAFTLNSLTLGSTQYPPVWTQGHILNIAPVYYVASSKAKADFHIYPLEVRKDTLLIRLYSDIPLNNRNINELSPTQDLLCYDFSTLRSTVSDASEQAHRANIMHQLDSIKPENLVVTVTLPDSLRGRETSNGVVRNYTIYPAYSINITMPFDF